MDKSERLFNPRSGTKIEAFDLFNNKHLRDIENFKFRVGAYGILRDKDTILMQRHPDLETFGIPGGGIEIDELLSEGLGREFEEETGFVTETGKLLFVSEDFFTYEGKYATWMLLQS